MWFKTLNTNYSTDSIANLANSANCQLAISSKQVNISRISEISSEVACESINPELAKLATYPAK